MLKKTNNNCFHGTEYRDYERNFCRYFRSAEQKNWFSLDENQKFWFFQNQNGNFRTCKKCGFVERYNSPQEMAAEAAIIEEFNADIDRRNRHCGSLTHSEYDCKRTQGACDQNQENARRILAKFLNMILSDRLRNYCATGQYF